MSLQIGFATKYFTLWDVSSEECYSTALNGVSYLSHVKTNYFYYQNLSITLEDAIKKAKEKGCKNLVVNEDLKGKRNSFFTEKKFNYTYPADEFDKGRYCGKKIKDCTDIDYLKWFFYNSDSEGERQSLIIKNLLSNGYFLHPTNEKRVLTADELKEVNNEIKKIEFEKSLSWGLNFEDGEKIDFNSVTVHNIDGFNGCYGFVNIYTFYTSDKKVFIYKGAKEYDLTIGQKINIKGTVKHSEYFSEFFNDTVRETKILRLKIN